MFPLICAWIKVWANTRDAGDLRRHRAHYDHRNGNVPCQYVTMSGMFRETNVNSPHKGQVTRNMFPFDDVIMGLIILDSTHAVASFYVLILGIQNCFTGTVVILYTVLWRTNPYDMENTGPWFNIKMWSYQYRKSHCGDKTVERSSYLHNGISYTGKTASLYWIGAQIPTVIDMIILSLCGCVSFCIAFSWVNEWINKGYI